MSPVILRVKEAPTGVPLEAESISPDLFADRSREEIEALPVAFGNESRRLGDFFQVEGERSDQIEVDGSIPRVKWVGSGMTRGRVVIRGDVGMHVGSTCGAGRSLSKGTRPTSLASRWRLDSSGSGGMPDIAWAPPTEEASSACGVGSF